MNDRRILRRRWNRRLDGADLRAQRCVMNTFSNARHDQRATVTCHWRCHMSHSAPQPESTSTTSSTSTVCTEVLLPTYRTCVPVVDGFISTSTSVSTGTG
jgi:hypothetical protein